MALRKVLAADDEKNILVSLKGALEDEGFVVETASDGIQALDRLKEFNPEVVLLDIWMPGEDGLSILEKMKGFDPNVDVVMMSGHGTIETAVKAIRLGAYDFLEKPLHFDKLLVLLNHIYEVRALRMQNTLLQEELDESERLIGESVAIKKLLRLIEVTAPSNGWVLIQGENGTGKELVAKALHRQSLRNKRAFVAVNCAAIPDELIESELFGHERGSFTGAHQKKLGKFEQADGGTLFLDEVGDMSPKMQAKILRALQEGCFQRVGGQTNIDVDIRVIAATNKDLLANIHKGEFREDLYYRLKVIPLMVPPLRERKEDLFLLVSHFMKRYLKRRSKVLDEATWKEINQYPWPGNVRELKNWVERACILSEGEVIHAEKFEFSSEEEATVDLEHEDAQDYKSARAQFERNFLLRMLNENGGNISKTALVIGMERSHLHKKIKSYGIDLS